MAASLNATFYNKLRSFMEYLFTVPQMTRSIALLIQQINMLCLSMTITEEQIEKCDDVFNSLDPVVDQALYLYVDDAASSLKESLLYQCAQNNSGVNEKMYTEIRSTSTIRDCTGVAVFIQGLKDPLSIIASSKPVWTTRDIGALAKTIAEVKN
ncbi:hypothetical protein [Bufonid herpesvirus 1]|uniref:hypothetical protein n=1 Tax=Bufonid herpesvirus 1 TaxID=2282206 RepID=UPI000EB70ABF|nr:hypothetical protein [Bufonid herpesvirus 1]AXF48568.1 hypothetical protein [Bufonid herpesvirus 1]